MDLQKAVSDRLAFALKNNKIDATYREQILSVGARFLRAQTGESNVGNSLLYLPYLSCQACGGDTSRIVGVTTSWFLFHVAAYLMDKVEDRELDYSNQSEIGVTANLSTGMIFIAEWILNHLELDRVDTGSAWDIQKAFHESVLCVCSGQHKDLSIKTPNLDECWDIARDKSGAAFGLACYSGGRLAINHTFLLSRLENFGKYLGTIIQIGDDLEELLPHIRSNELLMDRAPIFRAYSRYLESDNMANLISGQPGIDRAKEMIAKSSILYLRLEAIKLAGLAKRELDSPEFVEDGRSELISILRHRPVIEGFFN
jgi:hypothetical protein